MTFTVFKIDNCSLTKYLPQKHTDVIIFYPLMIIITGNLCETTVQVTIHTQFKSIVRKTKH